MRVDDNTGYKKLKNNNIFVTCFRVKNIADIPDSSPINVPVIFFLFTTSVIIIKDKPCYLIK